MSSSSSSSSSPSPKRGLAFRIASMRSGSVRRRIRPPGVAGKPSPWSVVLGPDSAPRRVGGAAIRVSGAAFIVSNLQDGFTVSLFLALLLSVVLLLYIISQLTGIGLGSGNSSGAGGNNNVQGFVAILLKAVADFGFVAGFVYYLILYHSMMDGGF